MSLAKTFEEQFGESCQTVKHPFGRLLSVVAKESHGRVYTKLEFFEATFYLEFTQECALEKEYLCAKFSSFAMVVDYEYQKETAIVARKFIAAILRKTHPVYMLDYGDVTIAW